VCEVAKVHGLRSGDQCRRSIAQKTLDVCTASAQLGLRPASNVPLPASRGEAAL
jgi:hypothetical protein